MEKIGFAAGQLFQRGVRIDVLAHDEEGLLFINKPTGCLLDVCKEEPHGGGIFVKVLRKALADDKPELRKYNIEAPTVVYPLDSDSTGVGLIVLNKEARERVRNSFGACEFEFRYIFFAREEGDLDEEVTCDLPIFYDDERRCVRVSHKLGKKAKTVFRRLERLGEYGLWEARCDYVRGHQVRVHACEVGLGIIGESFYGREPHLYLSSIKKGYLQGNRKQERPLYDGMALHLQEVIYKASDGRSAKVEAPAPKRLEVMAKHMREYLK